MNTRCWLVTAVVDFAAAKQGKKRLVLSKEAPKYPLHRYIIGVITYKTAWDQHSRTFTKGVEQQRNDGSFEAITEINLSVMGTDGKRNDRFECCNRSNHKIVMQIVKGSK